MSSPSKASGIPEKLRIAYLLQQFPLPSETFAVSDIMALLAQRYDVTVFTLKRRRRDEERLLKMCGVPEGLRINRPGLNGARTWPSLLWGSRKLAARLVTQIVRDGRGAPVTALQSLLCIPRLLEIANALRETPFDVVHAFWARHIGLVLPIIEAQEQHAVRTAFVGAYDLVADDFLVQMTLSSAAAVFSHAEVNRPYVMTRVPAGTEIHIVRRGIPLSTLQPEPARDPFAWLTASSLIPPKNVEGVIRTFARAREVEPRLKLRIFGQGPDRPRLERIVRDLGCSDRVEFAGHAQRQVLFTEMQRSSVFLLLSKGKWERLPNVLKEALWAGCSVISSQTDGIEELIPSKDIGYVVNPEDNASVEAAVSAILQENASSARKRRRKAREHVARTFSTDASMGEYVAAWRALLQRETAQPAKA